MYIKLRHTSSLFLALLLLAGCSTNKKNVSPQIEEYKYDAKQSPVIAEAHRWLGTKYVYGGNDKNGIDCSGFVLAVFRDACNMKLPRTSTEQQKHCSPIKRKDLRVGDLVFFAIGRNEDVVNHVAIYIGDGKLIHATKSRGVAISSINEPYWHHRFHSAGRLPQIKKPVVSENKTPAEETMLEDVLNQKLDSIYSAE